MNEEPKTRVFRLPITLTPSQKLIEASFKRFNLIRAGRKFGKTKYAEWKALQWMGPPNSVHWHIAPTYRQGRLISWESFKRLIPHEAMSKKPNDSDLMIQLKNGSQLYLMGSDEPDSLRGPSPTSVTFEEASYHKPDVWEHVIRPNLAVHKAPALFISSPNGFNWFKDLEDEALESIEAGKDEWSFHHFTIYDNPHIDRDEIEKIKSKCDPRVWSQEYMANYEASVGRVFHEFQDTKRHVYAFPMPVRNESCYRSIDWGMRDDTAALWAIIRGKKLHIYREHAENGLPASAQAKIIINRTTETEKVDRNIIGHDAAKQDSEMRGLTVQWHFTNAGIRPLRLSSRNKNSARAMIQQLISQDRLVVHPECRKLRKQLLSYSWKDTAMEKTEDGGDDLVDSLHYLCELLQYDLLLDTRRDDVMSRDEKLRLHKIEYESMNRHLYKLNQEEPSKMFETAGSPAGYL